MTLFARARPEREPAAYPRVIHEGLSINNCIPAGKRILYAKVPHRRRHTSSQKMEFFMSQEKVDRYKEEKKNRKQLAKKEKTRRIVTAIIAIVLVVALVLFVLLSAIDSLF
jgi:hypothetical protein